MGNRYLMELSERIEIARDIMHQMYFSSKFTSEDLVDISSYIDLLLNEYEKLKTV